MHAGVVGAGIMGRLLALRLLDAGWQVSLFDKNLTITPEFNCSYAAAGLLTPVSELDKADLVIHRLGLDALNNHWPSILQQLPASIDFQRNGCLVVHHPQDTPEWQQFRARIASKLGNHFYQALNQDNLIQLEPDLGKLANAYFIPDEGHIDSQAVLTALERFLRANGVTWHANTQVTSVKPGQITTPRSRHLFDFVFDCRGLGATDVFPSLRGLRGELIWLHAPDVQLQHPIRFLHPRYSIYIVPRPDHHYLIGASELETADYGPISVRSTLELLTAAYYVHAGFAEARVIKTVTHCRPTLPHHLPCIKMADQFIAVNGLYRHGYLIAPTLADEIIQGLDSTQKGLQYPELWETYHDYCLH